MDQVKLGNYRHYKGAECEVVGVAKHSETLEEMVVYKHLDRDGEMWVRPVGMFLEEVDKDGYKGPRFKYLDES